MCSAVKTNNDGVKFIKRDLSGKTATLFDSSEFLCPLSVKSFDPRNLDICHWIV